MYGPMLLYFQQTWVVESFLRVLNVKGALIYVLLIFFVMFFFQEKVLKFVHAQF